MEDIPNESDIIKEILNEVQESKPTKLRRENVLNKENN